MRDVLVRALSLFPSSAGRRAAYVDTRARLEAGRDAPRTDRVVRALLRQAESDLARRKDARASEALTKALTLIFHPVRAAGTELPALLEDPAGVLRVLDEGAIGEVLGRRPGTSDSWPASVPDPAARPTPVHDMNAAHHLGEGVPDHTPRVLVVTGGGLSFLQPVLDVWQAAGYEVRTLEMSDLPAAQRPTLRTVVAAAVTTWRTGKRAPVPPELAARLSGFDHLHVEWGDEIAAWLSHLALPGHSLSVRIHKYEILTPYPQLLAASQVDTLCFVAPHVRDAALRIAPRLTEAHRIDVTQNALDLHRFTGAVAAVDLPADLPAPEHVLGVVGWAGPAKDAEWAIDVLDKLTHADDGPWTLVLVGPEPPVRGSDAQRATRLMARIAAAGSRVRVLGRREDVPAVLPHLGWVISASVIEGTHEAIAEGAASGCVPIVRDWPQVRGYGGASTVYPTSWLVQDPEHAARRILAARSERQALAREATAWIRKDRDPETLALSQRAWIPGPYDHELRGAIPRPEGGTA